MVKKLLKYEFSSFAKTILPMEIVLLGIALLTRAVQLFETEGTTYSIFMWSSIIMLIIAMIVCIVMTVVVCTVRFYKNLFTAEGYLTLTLPVTHTQHITAKLITSVCATLLSVISVIAALAIATAGDVFHEIVKAGIFFIKKLNEFLGINMLFYSLEAVVLILLVIAAVYLLFYACISVGQLAKKNRVLCAFGVYFGYYVLKQILGTVFIIVYVNIRDKQFFIELLNWMAENPKTAAHTFAGIAIVITALLSVIYFAISRYIIKNKLNIE